MSASGPLLALLIGTAAGAGFSKLNANQPLPHLPHTATTSL